jgi:putative transposase
VVRLAQEHCLSLTGPDGLLKQLTKTVLETVLNEEMTEHLAMRNTIRPRRGRATSATAPAPRPC